MKKWIKAAGIRAIYTIAETALGIIGGSKLFSEVNWKIVVSASLLSGIVSILKSVVVGLPEIEKRK
jgi:hypothetical protein